MGVGAWEARQYGSVLCAILHTDDTSIAWAFGLRNLQIPGQVIGLAGMPYDMARNQACMRALECGAEYLFFLDSDVIPPHDAVLRLMAHKLPIVSGIYCRRSPPVGVPVMMKPVGQWIKDFPKNCLIEVDVVGAGCLLIHRSVLQNLPPQRPGHHWFDWRVNLQNILPQLECLSEDFTFCFTDDTWIAGPHMKTISQVRVGDVVVDHRGDYRKVLKTSCRNYTGRLIKINSYFTRGIKTTPSHKFYIHRERGNGKVYRQIFTSINGSITPAVVEDGIGMWVEAKDLVIGDRLCIPKIKFQKQSISNFHLASYINLLKTKTFSDGKVGYNRNRKCALRLNPTIEITPKLCRLIGYYIAEGFNNSNDQAINFAFCSDCKEDIADCRQILEELFGAYSSEKTIKGCTRVTCSSKLLGELFGNLCGRGAHNKHLPPFWSGLSQECLEQLIRGYWKGDGSFNRYFSMTTMSNRLAREVQSALLRLNILCGIHSKKNDYGMVYRLNVPSCQFNRFENIIRFNYTVNRPDISFSYFSEDEDYFFVQIKDISEIYYDGEVYNLKVANSESYTANTFAVHNCMHAKKHGYNVIVDTSIMCRHIGLAQSTHNNFGALDATPVT